MDGVLDRPPGGRRIIRENSGGTLGEAHAEHDSAAAKQERLNEILSSLQETLRLNRGSAETHNELGHLLRWLGRIDEAVTHYRCALRLRPDAILLHENVAALLADPAYSALVGRLQPGDGAIYARAGARLLTLGLVEEADACLRYVLQLRPDDPDALNNLGTALWEQGQPDDAEACYRAALRLQSDNPDILNNLGNALWHQGKAEEAADVYRRALRLKPYLAETQMNLGIVLSGLGEQDEALTALRQAIALRPEWPAAHQSLGVALARQGNRQQALACDEEALRLQPDFAEAHRSRAMSWLAQGDFTRGWLEYEWRWRCKGRSLPSWPQPFWDGDDLAGRTILLHAEQGFGDSLQFIRYASLVKERGGRVVVVCPAPLAELLARVAGVDQVLSAGSELPAFDVHAPLMSLPRIFGTTLDTVPAAVPYLLPVPEARDRWRERLRGTSRFKVGIAWQGNRRYALDRMRSFPLTQFKRLAEVAGVCLISLQKGTGTEQVRALEGQFPVTELGLAGEALGDFLETAAVVANLDLVVTPDLSVAHLAGGLGRPVWLALPHVAEWRWLEDRDNSPWYPTMRLFRQARAGEWDEVFGRMAAALRRQMQGTGDG